jgi:hypothetical protein
LRVGNVVRRQGGKCQTQDCERSHGMFLLAGSRYDPDAAGAVPRVTNCYDVRRRAVGIPPPFQNEKAGGRVDIRVLAFN